jgi:peptidyl-tRNA hydrolase, PTH2 family
LKLQSEYIHTRFGKFTMQVKQVIVIRKDLNMRYGKAVAQGAHASMAAVLNKCTPMQTKDNTTFWSILVADPEMAAWLQGKFTKICVRVDTEADLLAVYEAAKAVGLNCSLIQDSGQTEFGGVPTYTAVAVGPNAAEKVDPITGHLKLL